MERVGTWCRLACTPKRKRRRTFPRQGFETYLPRYLKRRRHARRTETVAAPLYPCYLFVTFDPAVQRWRSIHSTIGVTRQLRNGDVLATIESTIIDRLKDRENDQGFIEAGSAGRNLRPVIGFASVTAYSATVSACLKAWATASASPFCSTCSAARCGWSWTKNSSSRRKSRLGWSWRIGDSQSHPMCGSVGKSILRGPIASESVTRITDAEQRSNQRTAEQPGAVAASYRLGSTSSPACAPPRSGPVSAGAKPNAAIGAPYSGHFGTRSASPSSSPLSDWSGPICGTRIPRLICPI